MPFGSNSFLLRDFSKQLLDELYTSEHLDIRIKKAQSETVETLCVRSPMMERRVCDEHS